MGDDLVEGAVRVAPDLDDGGRGGGSTAGPAWAGPAAEAGRGRGYPARMASPHLSLTLDPGVCGDDLVDLITVLDDTGAPIDTTAVVAAAFGMRHEDTGQLTPAYALGSGVTVESAPGAVFRCTVPKVDSAKLRPGWWVFQLRVDAPARTTTAYGRRRLLAGVV